jgi:hypothetical protein
MKRIHTQRGYTLLFATLTATVVLTVAIFIASVSRKQYILSSTARDSLYAIYNADSALECAAVSLEDVSAESGGSFRCNGTDVYSVPSFNTPVSPAPAGFQEAYKSIEVAVPFTSGADEKGCAKVSFTEGTKDNGDFVLIIESRGYNLGSSAACPVIGPRTVERALRVTYGE